MKNLDRYNRITSLQQSLNQAESNVLSLYLNSFYAPFSSDGSVYESVFKEMDGNTDYDQFLINLNWGNKNDDSVRKNLERYEEKLFESLVIPINVNRKESLESLDRDYIRILWYLQVAKRLLILGSIDNGLRILRKILKIGKRIESFDFVLASLYQISSLSTFRQIPIKSLKIRDEIAYYEKARNEYNRSHLLREDVFRYNLISNLSESEGLELSRLFQQSEELVNTKHPSVKRNVLYAQLLYFDKQKEYSNCQEICKTLDSLIESNYSIRKKRERDTLKVNLVLFSILELDFSKSKELVSGLLNDDSISGPTKNFLDVLYARILLNNGEVKESIRYTDQRLSEKSFSMLYKSQMELVKGVASFLSGDYKYSIGIFSDIEDLKKDKTGWNFFARGYLILAYFKANMYDVALNELENFKRYLHGKKLDERQSSIFLRIKSIVLNSQPSKLKGHWDPTSPEIFDMEKLFADHI